MAWSAHWHFSMGMTQLVQTWIRPRSKGSRPTCAIAVGNTLERLQNSFGHVNLVLIEEDDLNRDIIAHVPAKWGLNTHDRFNKSLAVAAKCVPDKMNAAVVVLNCKVLRFDAPLQCSFVFVKVCAVKVDVRVGVRSAFRIWEDQLTRGCILTHLSQFGSFLLEENSYAWLIHIERSGRLELVQPALHAVDCIVVAENIPQAITSLESRQSESGDSFVQHIP